MPEEKHNIKNHLCFHCIHAKKDETEHKRVIYVSFGCKLKNIDDHAVVVRLPMTDHVIECPRYQKIHLSERLKRKFLWWL